MSKASLAIVNPSENVPTPIVRVALDTKHRGHKGQKQTIPKIYYERLVA